MQSVFRSEVFFLSKNMKLKIENWLNLSDVPENNDTERQSAHSRLSQRFYFYLMNVQYLTKLINKRLLILF